MLLKKTLVFMVFMVFMAAMGIIYAHTLFIKPTHFYLRPNQNVSVPVLNGTFYKNESSIQSKWVASKKIVGPGDKLEEKDTIGWQVNQQSAFMSFHTNTPGNYVIGVATHPRKVRVPAGKFDQYLRFEGLLDNITQREINGETEFTVTERYTKYAKAIVQTGSLHTPNYSANLGHVVEIIPLDNPYTLAKNDVFRATILKDGKPLKNHLVYAMHDGSGTVNGKSGNREPIKVRSDAQGEIAFRLLEAGRWYVKFIDLRPVGEPEYWYTNILVWLKMEEPAVFYESHWSTLTFEIK